MSITYKNINSHPLYATWSNMLSRCRNKNSPDYPYYGGRGITVCDRWRSFKNFYADMGDKPSKDYMLDRTDNDAGYSPDNCEWVTRSEQMRNRRLFKNGSSNVRGVNYHSGSKKWHARIGVDSKLVFVGGFDKKEDAIEARLKAEKEYWA